MAEGPRPAAVAERRPRARRALALAALAALSGAALIAAGNAYVLGTTRGQIVPGVGAAPERPTAIVLGNRIFAGGIPGAELEERLALALALHRAGRARRLLVSGAAHGDYDEPAVMAAWLERRGVPLADILLDRGGHRTAATMADAAAWGIRSALVCTQAYHLPRALYLARKAGIDALGVPAGGPGAAGGHTVTRVLVREILARAEAVVEVALRGVQAQ
jgi:SanA protein